MYILATRMVMLMLLICIVNKMFGQEVSAGPGNPPNILLASLIDDSGRLELVSYRTTYVGFSGESYNSRSVKSIELSDVEITTIAGQRVSRETARSMIKQEMPILVMSWREPISQEYLPLFAKETLVFTFPGEAPKWQSVQEAGRPVK